MRRRPRPTPLPWPTRENGDVEDPGRRIKLKKADSGEGSHKGHHHYIDEGLVADVEGNRVRLSANAAVAVTFEEEK